MPTLCLRMLLCASLTLSVGCGTLAGDSGFWVRDHQPKATLRAARKSIEAGDVAEGKRTYEQLLASTQQGHKHRAEALYELALLHLSQKPSLYDPGESLALLHELQLDFPSHQPEEVKALVQVLDDLFATRSDLGEQLATLRSVNANLDAQRASLKTKSEELSRVTEDLERQKAALKRVTETVIGSASDR